MMWEPAGVHGVAAASSQKRQSDKLCDKTDGLQTLTRESRGHDSPLRVRCVPVCAESQWIPLRAEFLSHSQQ
jgi:hypothetical protein